MGLGHDGADTAATRSGLAFAFLDLVERHRPECVLLENVPGLLSSHRGKDLGALVRRLGDAGYGWAFRVLDAQWFGVPQRRRRVFILALDLERHPDPDSAGTVLAVGAGCGRDHPAERAAWAGVAGGAAGGAGGSGVVGSLSIGGHVGIQPNGQDAYTGQLVVGAPPDPDRVRAADGLAGRLDGGEVLGTIQPGAKGWRGMRGDGADPVVMVASETGKGWWSEDMTTSAYRAQGGGTPHHAVYSVTQSPPTQRVGTVDNRGVIPPLTASLGENMGNPGTGKDEFWTVGDVSSSSDPLLPPGLDSHRYRVIGNGVVAPVAEWVGRRLAAYLAGEL